MPGVPLHLSLYELCRRQIASDPEFIRFKGFDTLPDVDRELFEDYRLFKLRRTLSYVAQRSRFYKKLFADAGIDPHEIRSIGDLASVPLTSAADVGNDPFAFLCTSQGKVERVITFISSGTVGPKKSVSFSAADIEAMTDYMAAGMKTVADDTDVVQILLPDGPVLGQSDLLARGVAKMGARPVRSGMFLPPEEQIETVRNNGSTVIFGETHLIYRITRKMEGQCDLSSLGIRTLFLTTSYASPVMINYLCRVWNARISTHYGLTEMGLGLAPDCPVCGAYHFDELDVIGEVIDPVTGQSLPPGSTGELVFTTLQRDAMPFIRYRTRDLAFFGNASAECGSNLSTIGHVKKRVESQVCLRSGAILYPTLFHDTVFKHPEVIDYDLTLDTLEDQDFLTFDIEVLQESDSVRNSILAMIAGESSIKNLQRQGLLFEVKLRGPGALQQGVHFKKMIKDKRGLPQESGTSGQEPMSVPLI